MKVDLTAQYVRVQLAGTNYLSLAEVCSRSFSLLVLSIHAVGYEGFVGAGNRVQIGRDQIGRGLAVCWTHLLGTAVTTVLKHNNYFGEPRSPDQILFSRPPKMNQSTNASIYYQTCPSMNLTGGSWKRMMIPSPLLGS